MILFCWKQIRKYYDIDISTEIIIFLVQLLDNIIFVIVNIIFVIVNIIQQLYEINYSFYANIKLY